MKYKMVLMRDQSGGWNRTTHKIVEIKTSFCIASFYCGDTCDKVIEFLNNKDEQ